MVKVNEVLFWGPSAVSEGELTDEALLAACGKGDRAALGMIFDRHHLAIYRFISRLAGADPNDVDDLLQNTFIEVARSAERYVSRSSVRNWIFGIAANVVKQHVKNGVRHRRVITALKAVPPPVHPSPHRSASDRQELERLAAAIEALPYKLKLPFVMYEIEGIPGVQIAEILGMRKGTVWRRLHEARSALVAALERGKA